MRSERGDLAALAADALGRGQPPAPLQTSLDEVNALGRALGDAGKLLAEDNGDARDATAQMLRLAGYEVVEAHDGESALARAAAERPDVVVLDIGMPGKDGHQVAAELRATPTLRHLPLIALSGYGQARDLAASAHAGFDLHLVKPVSAQALDDAIQTQLARVQLAALSAPAAPMQLH